MTTKTMKTSIPAPQQIEKNTKIALVTGAAHRLGKFIALNLAKNGWRVAIHFNSSKEKAIETAKACAQLNGWQGNSNFIFKADLEDENQAKNLINSVLNEAGYIDALVNSAAIFEFDDIKNFNHKSYIKHSKINTAAPILLAKELFNAAKANNKKSCVINILDQKLFNLNPDFLSYTLSKACLNTANTLLALSLAPQIRLVAIAPGLTLNSPWINDNDFENLHKQSPLGRSSTAQDIADGVLFAINNSAITGETILIDGGQHLMKFERDFSMMTKNSAKDINKNIKEEIPTQQSIVYNKNYIIEFSNLTIKSNLGILEHEIKSPQTIIVDAKICLLSKQNDKDDNINNVLDYRKIRQTIINICQNGHTNLLETLTEKICQRLFEIPNILGVKIKITKPEIFDDCQVSVSMAVGNLNTH